MILLNQGKRAFIVKPESVLKGGELHQEGKSMYINPGAQVEVEDETGTYLATYQDFKVIEGAKAKEIVKPKGKK